MNDSTNKVTKRFSLSKRSFDLALSNAVDSNSHMWLRVIKMSEFRCAIKCDVHTRFQMCNTKKKCI